MREVIQLDIVRDILTEYQDNIPIHLFLKDFYRRHKQFGSRDRRFYTEIIYRYLRCKTLFHQLPFEEKLCYSGFIGTQEINKFYAFLLRQQKITLPLEGMWSATSEEKLQFLETRGKIFWNNYFPCSKNIDTTIERDAFLKAHLHQPHFFIRVASNKIQETVSILNEHQLVFEKNGQTFSFNTQLDLSKYLKEGSYEVQDLSSQQTIGLLDLQENETVWDCCSGAGGKSLMLLDAYPKTKLYCSDKRKTILENLIERFQKKEVKPFAVDMFDIVKQREGLSFNGKKVSDDYFDLILADVPCSGSGTWGRNPERLYQFKSEELDVYSSIQKSVIENCLRYLKPGGKLVYITCSVYDKENTLNVKHFQSLGLKLIEEKYFIGYDQYADTMYGAVLVKQLANRN